MSRIIVKTQTSLSQSGFIGALILFFTPFATALGVVWAVSNAAENAARSARYGYPLEGGGNGFMGFLAAGVAVSSIALVMVLVGREYSHEVRILKPGEEETTDEV